MAPFITAVNLVRNIARNWNLGAATNPQPQASDNNDLSFYVNVGLLA